MKYIGIIGRPNEDKITYNKEIIKVIYDYNFIPLGIMLTNDFNQMKQLIDLCSGFILQGGNDYEEIELEIVRYLHNKNIPTLGICLGMQTMAMAFNGVMKTIGSSHNKKDKYVHLITIENNSKLFQIMNKKEIIVNSRHRDYIEKTNLDVCAKANIIEAIEDKNKDFFIGVQWHPESLRDKYSEFLFKYFFFIIK